MQTTTCPHTRSQDSARLSLNGIDGLFLLSSRLSSSTFRQFLRTCNPALPLESTDRSTLTSNSDLRVNCNLRIAVEQTRPPTFADTPRILNKVKFSVKEKITRAVQTSTLFFRPQSGLKASKKSPRSDAQNRGRDWIK